MGELDIFKLDIIAREMKLVLNKVGLAEKSTKELQDDAKKFKDYGEKQKFNASGAEMQDQCKQIAAHVHDVILKCLNEKQRMHIGVATDNEYKADDRRDGRILDGGSVICSIQEEVDKSALESLAHIRGAIVERPDYGKSRAAQLVRHDAV